ncbi:hypothetical protein JXR93_10915 [bacterium]|nr:hypothetical protein [bacterium]
MGFDSLSCFGQISKKPLKTYSSEYEAIDAVQYVKSTYGNNQIYYKCNRCGYWHLSPIERETPSITCQCKDEKGNFKQLYPTKKIAEQRANIIFEEKGIKLNVYECEYSNGWHLTHKDSCDYY